MPEERSTESEPPTPYDSSTTLESRRNDSQPHHLHQPVSSSSAASSSSFPRGEWDLTPRFDATAKTRATPGSTTRGGGSTPGTRDVVRTGPRGDSKPVYSRYKQEILSEEDYISNLSEIIKRDFFPQLHYLDETNKIRRGLESSDERVVEESIRKMREMCTPVAGTRRGTRRGNQEDTPGRTPFDSSYDRRREGNDTPTAFDQTPFTSTPCTPSHLEPPSSSRGRASPIDSHLSLDAFQSRYTSQDNSSFSNLLAKDNEQRREKTRWAWQAEQRASVKQIRGRQARERLVDVTRQMIESGQPGEGGGGGGSVWLLEGGKAGRPGERQVLVGNQVKLIEGDEERGLLLIGRDEKERLTITSGQHGDQKLILGGSVTEEGYGNAGGKGKEVALSERIDENAKQFVDWDRPAVEEEEANKAIRRDQLQVEVETWPFKNRNSLMFPPDADVDPSDPKPPLASTSANTTNSNGGVKLPMGEPKGIRYHATRLMEVENGGLGSEMGENGTPSPSRSRINAAISGTPYPSSSSSGAGVAATPRVNNFSFVSALPSPRAHHFPPQALQELMTWGSIEATPVTLRTTETDGSVGPFRIEDTSRREELAFKLAKKAKKSLADSFSNHSPRSSAPSGLATSVRSRGGILDTVRSQRGATPGGGTGGNATPRTGDHLSPAARQLLSKTKPGRLLQRGLRGTQTELTKEDKRKEEEKRMERARKRAREVESQDRLKRERWTPSPAVSLGFDPDLADQRFQAKHAKIQ